MTLVFLALGLLVLTQASPAAGQANCIKAGQPSFTGNKTLVNSCGRTVTIRYSDDFSCGPGKQVCTVEIPAGRSAVLSTPAGQGNSWMACWGRKSPRPGPGGTVLCE
jgi:hypothetical protein